MPTYKVARSFLKFAIILYAVGPMANAEAVEESITGINAIVQVSEESPVSYDPSLVDDAQFKDQVLTDHNVRLLGPFLTWLRVLLQCCILTSGCDGASHLFKSSIADFQNMQWYRAQHGSPALKWNDTLESASQEWVAKCANGFSVRHSSLPIN